MLRPNSNWQTEIHWDAERARLDHEAAHPAPTVGKFAKHGTAATLWHGHRIRLMRLTPNGLSAIVASGSLTQVEEWLATHPTRRLGKRVFHTRRWLWIDDVAEPARIDGRSKAGRARQLNHRGGVHEVPK